MPSPNLPTDITSGGTTDGHKPDSDLAWAMLNAIDRDLASAADVGDVLMWGGSIYTPTPLPPGGVLIEDPADPGFGIVSVSASFATVANMLASTISAQGVSSRWQAEGFTYKEAASGASDHHVTTAGGVKLYALPVNGTVNLAQLGLTTATTNITPLLTIAATIANHIVIPRNALAWNQTTVVQLQDKWIDFEPGARVNINMTTQAWELTRCKLTNASFTSPYSSALTAGASSTHVLGARRVLLGNDCIVENYYQEYAAGGITIPTGSNVDIKNFRCKNIREYKGWGPAIYVGATAKNVRIDGVKAEDCDRGIEVEDGASNVWADNGEFINIYPVSYTGQPGDYATYTFVIGAHGHAAGTPPVNVNFRNWVLTNCGGGIDFSTSADVAASPQSCSARGIRIVGYATIAGQNEAIYVSGHNNVVEDVSLELGAGINSKMKVRVLGTGAQNNRISNLRAIAYALALINVDDGATNTVIENVRVASAPTTGTGMMFEIDGAYTELRDNAIYSVFGTTGYVNIDQTAHGSRIDGFHYVVATAESFTNVITVVGPVKNVDITGVRGVNNATTPPQDIQFGNGALYGRAHGNSFDRGAGICVIAHSGSGRCEIIDNVATHLSAIFRNDSPTGIAENNISDYRDTSFLTGKFASLPDRAVTTGQLGNNTLRTTPVFIPETITIDQVGVEITVAGNAGAVFRIAIFPDDRRLPGTAIVDTTVAADAVGTPMATLGTPVRLNGGRWYHIGGVTQNAATTDPTLRVTTVAPDNFLIAVPTATTSGVVGYSKSGVSGALGAWGTPNAVTNQAARIWARMT